MTEGLFPRERAEVAPGAVHVPGWLPPERQRELVAACREWGRGPLPYRQTVLPGGGVMSVRSLCLGRRWEPYRYLDEVGVELPGWLAALGREALVEVYGEDGGFVPDTALVNFYDAGARMGMHQDKEERSGASVVSLSLGDRCVFRFGNTESRGRPYTDVELESGDLFVFGGPSRLAYHGVPKVYPGTAGPNLGLTGRLNITLRQTGLPVVSGRRR
ncbi:alpha-ketoglutarate-dependent dioxygenase AlkB [Streptomyces sp. ISL-36]|uniref:alpha-ketoglutarate-dependent dioxygenase AlkB family protein n=1 Tax=Streptomyces sp. ISL-36 TaxID=2819182 RepID=UPI001BEC87BB|nr:alpha-ketoglutarate-dependent dioxygenase AlkB [Streptomyces sp. ISL-36]MBT2443354.1 alpha-ketoglutarate-dependent dioxygenase AlkB [Streptomyces sp. ISL-36]